MRVTRGKAILLAGIALTSVLSGIFLTTNSINAAPTNSSTKTAILEKAAFYGLHQCYTVGKQIKDSIALNKYQDGTSITTGRDVINYHLPTGFTSVGTVSCAGLLDGKSNYGGLYGVAKSYGQSTPSIIPPPRSDPTAVRQYLEGMGYTSKTDSGDGKCTDYIWDVKYSGQTSGYADGQSYVHMCAKLDSNGNFKSNDALEITYFGSASHAAQFKASKGVIKLDCDSGPGRGGCIDHTYKEGDSYKAFRDAILSDLSKNAISKEVSVAPGVVGTFTMQNPKDGAYDTGDNEFTIADMNKASGAARKYLSNGHYSSLTNLKLNQDERSTLLLSYLYDFYGAEVITNSSGGCNNLSGDNKTIAESSAKQTRIYRDGKFETCYVRATKNQESKVPVYDNTSYYFTGVFIGFNDLTDRLNKMTNTTLPDGALSEPAVSGAASGDTAGTGNENGEDGDGRESPCTLAGGPLSWILCPVLSVVGKTVQFLYSWIEDQFLVVDANFYDTTSETYKAWQDFQGYANIFFIILLVLVIISQVTGFGISNYGIKKTLPKLIIAIILINISFFACQIAVDLSNIIGSTVENLLGDRAFGSGGFADTVGMIVSYAAGAVEVGAIGVGAFKLATMNPELFASWMPMIILVLIGCVLGVLFFFIILCVRQASIIVLIILSPLAIAAYALPNTKKLFDRWFKLFTALLLVYPICGLLMGGGRFVSGLLIESAANGDGGLGMILVGLLANIVPFFLVPSVLKSSMSAMGNLGAKISGFGDRINRALGRGVVASEFVKDRQQRKINDLNRARVERYNKITARGGSLSRGQQRKFAKSTAAMQKYQDEQQDLENLANSGDVLETLESRKATRQREYEEKQINDYASMVKNGGVRYTDSNGSEQTINANDVGSLREAQLYYARQAEQAANEQTRKRNTQIAQSLQLLQFGKGDTGRTEAVQNLADLVFGDKDGNRAYGKDSQIVKNLAQQIAANDKWMASLKAEDPGTFKLVNDITGKGPLKGREAYEKLDASKVSAASIPSLSDHVFNQFDKYQIKNGNGDVVGYDIKKIKEDLGEGNAIALSNHITRAMTDPRIANQIKEKGDIDNIGKLNAIREAAYQAEQENYIKQQAATGKTETELKAEFEKQYGKFRKLNVGDDPDTLKVRHARKVAMPTDWRPDPANNNRWTQFNPDGTVNRVLTPEEVIRAEEIAKYNAQVDINNELNDS